MASYTSPQVKALGQAQLEALPTTTWAVFSSDQLGYFEANQIPLIPAGSIAAISFANIGGLTSDAMKQLLPAQIKALTQQQLNTLTNVVSGVAKIMDLNDAQFESFSSSQIPVFQPVLFNNLGTSTINSFNKAAFASLTVAQFQQMTGVNQLNGLFSTEKLCESLAVDRIAALTSGQLALIAGNVTSLSNPQLAAIPALVFGDISGNVLSTFTAPGQVANITNDQFTALKSVQINALDSKVASVKATAIGKLSAVNNEMSQFSQAVVRSLTSAQLQSIVVSANLQAFGTKLADSQYTTDMAKTQLNLLSELQTSSWSSVVVSGLSTVSDGTAKMQEMNENHFSYLTYAQIASIQKELFGILSTSKINSIASDTMKGLTVAQFQQMTGADQLTGLFSTNNLYTSLLVDGSGNNCFGALTSGQVSTIGSNVTKLSIPQISNIPAIAFAYIGKDDLTTIASGNKSGAITSAQLQALTATQIANSVVDFSKLQDSCVPSKIQLQDTSGVILTIKDDIKNTFKINQVRALDFTCIPYLSQANVEYLSKVQFDALYLPANAAVLSAVSGNLRNAFITNILSYSPADINAMNVAASISAANNRPPTYQLALMSGSQISQLTSEALNALSLTQFNALPHLDSITSATIAGTDPNKFQTLDGETDGFVGYNNLTANQCELLSTLQIAAITNSAVKVSDLKVENAVAILNSGAKLASVKNIGSIKVDAFVSFTNTANLSLGDATNAQIKAITPGQFANLNAEAVSNLPEGKFGDIPAGCFAATFTKDASIRVAQITNISVSQIQSLTGKAPAVYNNAFNSLSAASAQYLLNTKMENINLNYYQYITANAFGTVEGASTFNNGVKISGDVATKLSVDQIKKIPAAAFIAIPAVGFVNLRSDAFGSGFGRIADITVTQATYIAGPPSQGLTPAQIVAMGSSAILLSNEVISVLTLAQVTSFATLAVQGLTQTQIGLLNSAARTIVYAVRSNSITSISVNLDCFNPEDIEATNFEFTKIAEDVTLNADVVVNVNMSVAAAQAAFQYRLNSVGTTDLFFNKQAFAVKYAYAPTTTVKIDSTKCDAIQPNNAVTTYSYPNLQWIGPTDAGSTPTVTGEIGLPASWEYMLYSARQLFGVFSMYNYFNNVYGFEKDLRSRINVGINTKLEEAFKKYSSSSSDSTVNTVNKIYDATLSKYYTTLENSPTSTTNFMSYIFDYIHSRQPSRFVNVAIDKQALDTVYGVPFMQNDKINFIFVVNPNASQLVYGNKSGASTVGKRTYKVSISITN